MAKDDDEGESESKKKKDHVHTTLYIILGVAGLVVSYLAYRAAKGSSAPSTTEVPVPTSSPSVESVPSSSAGSTTSGGGSSSSGSSSLISSLLSDVLGEAQTQASAASQAQTAAAQLASQQLAAAQQQNQSLLGDVLGALSGSHASGGGSSSAGSTTSATPQPRSSDTSFNLIPLANPSAAESAAANHQPLFWIPPGSTTPEQVPLGFVTTPGDRGLYTAP